MESKDLEAEWEGIWEESKVVLVVGFLGQIVVSELHEIAKVEGVVVNCCRTFSSRS